MLEGETLICGWCLRELPPPKLRGRRREFCSDHCRLRAWRWGQPTEDQLSRHDHFDRHLQRWVRTEKSGVKPCFRQGEPFRYQAPGVPGWRGVRVR